MVNNNFPEAASALEFTIEFEYSSIVPAALYQLATTQSEVDWDTACNLAFKERLNFGIRTARWNLLSQRSLLQVLNGSQNLGITSRQLERELGEKVYGCEDYEECSQHLQRIVLKAFGAVNDPLLSVLNFQQSLLHSEMCGTCRMMLHDRMEGHREDCWEGLFTIFDI